MSDEVTRGELVAEEVETDQYLVFSVRSREFGFQAMRVQEISPLLEVTQVPNAPPYIEGIMNLRGRIASVINFRKKFSFEAKEYDEDTRIIVVELGSFPIGIIVDSVDEVIRIPDEMVQQLPESITTAESEEYMTGIGMLDKRLIILLDLDKVLTSAELIEVAEIGQTLDKARTLETPGQTIGEADTGETPGKAETSEADTVQPVDTGKKRRQRRTA